MIRAAAAAAAAAALLAGCAIPPPPPAPDPIRAALVEEGRLPLPDPAWAAFCVSQEVPASLVELMPSGAAVRPAASGGDAYALVLRRAPTDLADAVAWRLLVAEPRPQAEDTVRHLRGALGGCLGRLGRGT